jgi:DNA-binding MarR family transcriptional regulator
MKHGVIAARVLPLLERENRCRDIAAALGLERGSVEYAIASAVRDGLARMTRTEPATRYGTVRYYILTAKGRAALEEKE